MRRRDVISAGLGAGLSFGQTVSVVPDPGSRTPPRGGARGNVPVRKVKTTPLFKSPQGYPNALRAVPEGFWIAEQLSGNSGSSNDVCLVDKTGKLLKTLKTDSRNTSGMGYGGGYLWVAANAPPEGIFQIDLNGKLVRHMQIPLGDPKNGGGCHGCMYHDGKIYIGALRLNGILRVDAQTWAPEFFISTARLFQRMHELVWDNGSIWMVTGTSLGPGIENDRAGLARFDATTGQLLETAEFGPDQSDPHGLTIDANGVFYSCDAGIHPGWPDNRSATHGYVFRIDFV